MLIFSFFLGCAALVLQAVLAPPFTLLVFAPWVALVCLRCSLFKALVLSALAGMVVDLFTEDPMGVHALNYVLAASILHPWRRMFLFEDNPLLLGLFTTFFSFTSTLLQLFLLFLFDRRVPFTGIWVLGDLIGMPIVDGVYALGWFAAPLFLYAKLRKSWGFLWHAIKQREFRIMK